MDNFIYPCLLALFIIAVLLVLREFASSLKQPTTVPETDVEHDYPIEKRVRITVNTASFTPQGVRKGQIRTLVKRAPEGHWRVVLRNVPKGHFPLIFEGEYEDMEYKS